MITNLVIGSGPSGLAVSKFLIENNQSVVLVDGSKKKHFKNNLFNFNLNQKNSPKYNSQEFISLNKIFKKKYSIKLKNFFLSSIIARGGLSNFWGGGLEYPDFSYLKKNNINIKEYNKNIVLAEIFLKNKKNKYSLEYENIINEKFKNFKNLFFIKKKNITKLKIALTNKENNFQKLCNFSNTCLTRCNRNSLYNHEYIIDNLQTKKMIIKDNKFVKHVFKNKKNYTIEFDDNTKLKVDRVFCCAGTIASTIIVARMLKLFQTPIRLFHNPMYQLLYFRFSKIKNYPKKISFPFTKVNLKYKNYNNAGSLVLFNDLNKDFFGNFFLRIFYKFFKNFIIGGNFFVSQFISNTNLFVSKNKYVKINSINEKEKENLILNKLSSFFKKNNFFSLPFLNKKMYKNGSDAHYTSSLHNLNIVNKKGELKGFKNFFILDGSIIPPGLIYPTLFIICNALIKLKKIIKNDKQI